MHFCTSVLGLIKDNGAYDEVTEKSQTSFPSNFLGESLFVDNGSGVKISNSEIVSSEFTIQNENGNHVLDDDVVIF